MKTCGLVLFLVLLNNLSIFSNDTALNDIDKYISVNDFQNACELITSYIKENPASDNIPLLLDKYISIRTDIDNIISFYKGIEDTVTGINKYYVYRNLAEIEELYGRIDSAQQYFHNAAVIEGSSKQAECYFESARLLYEIGNIDMAIIELSTVFLISSDLDLVSRAFVLKAHLFKSKGDYEEASKIYKLVINNYKGYEGEIEAVFSMAIFNFYNLNDISESEKYLELLYALAPDSPEYQIASNIIKKTNTEIIISLTPQRFLEYYKLNGNSAASKTEDVTESQISESLTEPDKIIYVQTGSFIIKENAEYMVSDLSAAGFNAEILSEFINNTLYYKVVIGAFTSNQDANSVLIRVKESGFQGFLLFK